MRVEIGVHEGLSHEQIVKLLDGLDGLFDKDPAFKPTDSGHGYGSFDYAARGDGPATAELVQAVAKIARDAGLEMGFQSKQLVMALFPE